MDEIDLSSELCPYHNMLRQPMETDPRRVDDWEGQGQRPFVKKSRRVDPEAFRTYSACSARVTAIYHDDDNLPMNRDTAACIRSQPSGEPFPSAYAPNYYSCRFFPGNQISSVEG